MNKILIKLIKVGTGKIIFTREGNSLHTILDCPVCEILIRDRTDVVSYKKYGCCSICELEIVYLNKEKWKNGWRPPVRELNKLRKKRKKEPSYLMFERG